MRAAALVLLRAYQLTLSPFLAALGVRCRHWPSCSAYACDCIRAHGLWAGGWMTLARLSRCRPGGSWGHDPAPAHAPAAPIWAPWRLGSWRLPAVEAHAPTIAPRTRRASGEAACAPRTDA